MGLGRFGDGVRCFVCVNSLTLDFYGVCVDFFADVIIRSRMSVNL